MPKEKRRNQTEKRRVVRVYVGKVSMNRHRSLSMTNIRQRKADQSPQSGGGRLVTIQNEEMMSIVIEPEEQDDDYHNDNLDFASYHATPQPPRMIPDKHYKDFMQGRTSKQKEATFLPTGPECASLCIGFSWVAVAFLVSSTNMFLD